MLGLSPVFGWSYESGAKVGDASTFGAIATATKVYSPRLVLGLGAGVIRQVNETKVFPLLIVRWQIDERWRIANPFPAGPAGGVGLELAYSPDERWDFAVGGSYRSTRFRLDDHGAGNAGVGAYRFYPLFARIARSFGPRTRVDLYAGVGLGGHLSVTDTNGTTIARDDYSAAPLLGLTLSHRYSAPRPSRADARAGRVVRRLRDSVRRQRHDARRHRLVGIRRSAGRELEPRLAPAGGPRVARKPASRAAAAPRAAGSLEPRRTCAADWRNRIDGRADQG